MQVWVLLRGFMFVDVSNMRLCRLHSQHLTTNTYIQVYSYVSLSMYIYIYIHIHIHSLNHGLYNHPCSPMPRHLLPSGHDMAQGPSCSYINLQGAILRLHSWPRYTRQLATAGGNQIFWNTRYYMYMYMYMYMYVYVGICVYMCVYVYVHAYVYVYVYVYVCICTCMYAYVCICMYVYVYVCICWYMYVYVRISMYL